MAVHPEWTCDMRYGKMYIFFGNTVVYGPAMPNTYGVKLSCKSTAFAIKPVLGYRKPISMDTYLDVAKAEVIPRILSMVATWDEKFDSEDITITGEERHVGLLGKSDRMKIIGSLAAFLHSRGMLCGVINVPSSQ